MASDYTEITDSTIKRYSFIFKTDYRQNKFERNAERWAMNIALFSLKVDLCLVSAKRSSLEGFAISLLIAVFVILGLFVETW